MLDHFGRYDRPVGLSLLFVDCGDHLKVRTSSGDSRVRAAQTWSLGICSEAWPRPVQAAQSQEPRS